MLIKKVCIFLTSNMFQLPKTTEIIGEITCIFFLLSCPSKNNIIRFTHDDKDFSTVGVKYFYFKDGIKYSGGLNMEVVNKVKKMWSKYLQTYFEDIPRSKEEIADRLPDILKRIALGGLNIVLGYLFGSMAMAYSAMPLGTAYLSSVKKYTGFVYIGLAISAASEKTGLAVPLFLIYTALYLARVIVYRSFGKDGKVFGLFEEGIVYKLIEGFSASLFVSAYRAASFGFLYYDILGGLFEITVVPLVVLAYEFAFNEKYKFDIKREIGFAVLFASVILASSNTFVLGCSVGLITASLITLFVSKKAGAMRGGIYGLLCGFACNPVVSAVFAVMGMSSGIMWKFGNAAALSVASFLGIVGSIYVEGWNSLTIYAPEILCAAILFYPFAQFNWLPKLSLCSFPAIRANDDELNAFLAEKRQKDTEKRLADLSEAFSELSTMFYTLSDRSRSPGIIDTRQICDEACDRYCTKCFYKNTCWERESSSTQDVFSKIAKSLRDRGYVSMENVDGYMRDRCLNMPSMLERINDTHAEVLEKMIRQNKTEVFAMDYEAMSHLLSSAVKNNYEEFLPDKAVREKIVGALKGISFSSRNVCVYGRRKINIVAGGVEFGAMKMPASDIKTCLENVCETKMTEPRFEVEGNYVTMSIQSAKKYEVEYAGASNTKKNEQFCGDMVCMFENSNDYFYSLISDGMGSGREAALTSRLCGVFLKKMLLAGNSKPVAIEMLNNFIRSKNTECFSTVDLLEIDLINGNATFIKSGAAASYVMRGDKLFRIASNTMPVGITREINAEEVKFALEEGDVVVMVSDGVGQSDEDTVRVSNILTYYWEDDLQKMADKIMLNALENGSRSDDVSVGIIKINGI